MSKKILCVGLTCLDIVQTTSEYPFEDTDQRALSCRMQRGGNASNNCTVLSLLGSTCEYLGTISTSLFWEFIKKDFNKYDIGFDSCKIYSEYEFPLSTVIINTQNGSRTIIHSNNNLPELQFKHFKKLNLKDYSWIHFEGRNIIEVTQMVQCVIEFNKSYENPITISVELEKKRELLNLVSMADVIFVGKDFSKHHNWDCMERTLNEMRNFVKQSATVISAWGEEGAMASSPEGIFSSPAYPPAQMIDTLGAGDVFCAGVIYGLSNSKCLEESLHLGCKVAGFKVGICGYDDIRNFKF